MRSRAFGRALIALVLLASMAELAGTAHAASAAVVIDGFRFLPQAVTVNVGETVTWTNRDPAQHTATSAGAFDTGVLAMGQSKTVQLNTAGTFEYRCLIHGAMTGTVRVIAQATPTPARPPTAVPTVASIPPPPPTPSPTAPPTTAPPASSPSASPTTAPTTPAPSTPAPETASPAPAGGGPGPTLAVVAGLLAAGLVGLGVYLARRR